MDASLTAAEPGLEVAFGLQFKAPVATGLVEVNFQLTRLKETLESCRLVMAHPETERICFEKEVALEEGPTRFWLAINSHLLPNGHQELRFAVLRPDDTEMWSGRLPLDVANEGALAEKVRKSLQRSDTPLVLDGVCDTTDYDYGDPSVAPWFDRSDAADHIEAKVRAGEITDAERDSLEHFVENGYLILPEKIEEELLRQIDAEVDRTIESGYQGYEYGTSQRLEKLHETCPGIRKLWLHPKILHYLGLIFDAPARPCQTLLYVFGSQQDLHQDTIHLTPFPAGYMCGVWIALEDIQPNSGELEIVPGSHRLPRVYMADAGCDKSAFYQGQKSEFAEKVLPIWERMAEENELEKVPYRPNRGTVLVWHENLMHGGSVRRDPTLSRKSLVTHNFADGAIALFDSLGTPGFMLALSEVGSGLESNGDGADGDASGEPPAAQAAAEETSTESQAPAQGLRGLELAQAGITARLDTLTTMVGELANRFQLFQDMYLESRSDLWERSRVRWRGDEDDLSLTWGVQWTGDAFIDRVLEVASFDDTTAIIEVGPGYGRLLDTLLARDAPFASYVGVELSDARVARLSERYAADPRIRFISGDVETFRLDDPHDVCISSATFMHLFPNFEHAVENVRRNLKIGGVLCFDVSEGATAGRFQDDGVTYGRMYSESEIRMTFDGTNFGKLFLDRVEHGNDHKTGQPVEMLFVGVTRLS